MSYYGNQLKEELPDDYTKDNRVENIKKSWSFNNDVTVGGKITAGGNFSVDGTGNIGGNTLIQQKLHVGFSAMTGDYLLNINGTSHFADTAYFDQLIQGTALRAQYADIAEKYKCDYKAEPGDILTFGGEFEVTKAKEGDRIFFPVSSDPSVLMNDRVATEDYIAIGLLGRIPVKVKGKVSKNDLIVISDEPGIGIASKEEVSKYVGIALEVSDNEEIKLIECFIRV